MYLDYNFRNVVQKNAHCFKKWSNNFWCLLEIIKWICLHLFICIEHTRRINKWEMERKSTVQHFTWMLNTFFSGNTIGILNLGCWIQVSAFSSCGWFSYFTHREQAWSLMLCNFYFAIRLFLVVWDLIHFWPCLTPYKYLHFLFSMSQYQKREEYRYRMDFYWVSSMSSPKPGTLDT